MPFHKRDKDAPTARVQRYGLPFGPEDPESERLVRAQMLRAYEYQVELVAIFQAGRMRYREIMSAVPEVAEVQAQIDAAQAEIEISYAAIHARRQNAKKRKIPTPELPRIEELKSQLETLVHKARTLSKKVITDDLAIAAALQENNARCDEEEKAARAQVVLDVSEGPGQPARTGLYWSTYNLISHSVRQGCKTPNGPTSQPYWNGEGRIGVQLQGGLTVRDLLAGADTQLRLEVAERVPRRSDRRPKVLKCAHGNALTNEESVRLEPPCGCRQRTTQAYLRIRVGSTPNRKPIWASFAIAGGRFKDENGIKRYEDLRSLPKDAVVKLAVVTKRRHGTRSVWELHLTFESEQNRPGTVRDLLGPRASLDIGWRARLPGLRVFYLVGKDDDYEQELLAPKNIELGFDKADEIRGRRDVELDAAKKTLSIWLKSPAAAAAPLWLLEVRESLPHWRSAAKLSRLISRWRDARFDDDVEIFEVMIKWWHHNRHLYQYESSQRRKTLNRRNYEYRLLAKEIVKRYCVLTLEMLDLRSLIERKLTKEELHQTARRNRFIAAPGVFREILLYECEKAGTTVIKKPAQYTTITCHVCKKKDKFDKRELVHTCIHCGCTWDQDSNASKNLERISLSGIPASGEAAQ